MGEAGHGTVTFGDALADGRAVASLHHGRGKEVQIRIAIKVAGIPSSLTTVAAGAVGLVQLGRRQSFPGAGGEQRHRDEEQERPELQSL